MRFHYEDEALVDVEQEVNAVVEFEVEISGVVPFGDDYEAAENAAAEVLGVDERDVVVSAVTVDGERTGRPRRRVPIEEGVRTYVEGSMLVKP